MTLSSFLESNNYYFAFAASLITLYLAKELFLKTIKNHPSVFYLILFPGVLIHELSHIVGCLVVGAHIVRFSLFNLSGGYVEHLKTRNHLWSEFVISIAPLLSGSLIVYFISLMLIGFDPYASSAFDYLKIIALIYLLSAVLLTMLPSKKDFANAPLQILIFLFIVFFVFIRFPPDGEIKRLLILTSLICQFSLFFIIIILKSIKKIFR